MKTWSSHLKNPLLLAVAIFLIASGYFVLQLHQKNLLLEKQVADLQSSVASAKDENSKLAEALQTERDKNNGLTKNLEAEQNRNNAFNAQIQQLSGTVGTLQKLSTTDPELLKKYSKVYFLSENYAPSQLSSIDSQYLYDKKRTELIHPGVLPYIQSMIAAAGRDGITLQVVSAYRSFYEQASLKLGYKITYGSGANQFSAEQGYSEHQLGTTVDVTSPEVSDPFYQFDGTIAYKWIISNAYRFGFVLSYPKSNTYYQFEPWHWRFVGVPLATKLHNANSYFYNLSQQEIDQYLVQIFD